MVDFFLVLMLPGAGDELQGIKRGILELADALAINKADGDNLARAERARAEYSAALHLMRAGGPWEPPVLVVSATEGRGIDTVWQIIGQHRARLSETGELEKKRARQRHRWLSGLLEDGIRAKIRSRPEVVAAIAEAERAIDAQTTTPTAAARRVLALL